MDNHSLLEKLTKSFNRDDLTQFFRDSSGKFKPKSEDYRHYIQNADFVKDLQKLGSLEFEDTRRMILLAGELNRELTTQSGKLKQYEIAKQILKQENLDAGIFVFHDGAGHFRFSWITAQYTGTRREFSSFRRYTYFVSPESSARTFVEQIGKADFSSVEKIAEAFSVEPVTKEFFRKYREIFEEAEATIKLKWTDEKKRLYTQRFFNRVMFLAFLERKGWLKFTGSLDTSGLDTVGRAPTYSTSGVRRDYLRALFADYHAGEKEKNANFHRSRLNVLFFWGLNNPRGDERSSPEFRELSRRIGDVPYLNGGLFDQEADDEEHFFPDALVAKFLGELIYQFNFTVTESTPLDIEVAVDPEMLGRIFEELVTGRHESGSYYTPKPVVAFMCREALKGYLETAVTRNSFRADSERNKIPPNNGESAEAIARFVDRNEADDLRDSEKVLTALQEVKVCDPACGSGAYLLGMLHELLEQRACLFAAKKLDAKTIYDRKLEIIQNNLYGVDLDPFAVSIARLRLWLSLIVDYEGDNPPPLPNLDFKIESGDSLTAPDPSGGLQPDMFRQQQVKDFLSLKNEFMGLHAGSDNKKKLDKKIQELREKIREWAHVGQVSDLSYNAFDWQVDFAEVFAPELAEGTLRGKMAGLVNATKGQMELTDAPKEGGFDIILANPPYVRQELLGDYKEELKPIYPEVYSGLADLFIYFYARAHQLLKENGVACFISSNKWLRAGYGEKLRQHLLDSQAFKLVVDFGDLPVFQSALAYPCIFLWQKRSREDTATFWAEVNNLQECYEEGISNYISRVGFSLPSTQFGKGQPRIANPHTSEHVGNMAKNSVPLGEYVDGKFYRGIVSGLNEAFIVDFETHEKLQKQDSSSKKLFKPLLRGDNVRKYELHYRYEYYIYVEWECPIKEFPAIYKHLTKFKEQLESRPEVQQGRFPWYAMSRYGSNYAHLYEKPKIIYPVIGKEPHFSLDTTGYYGNDKTFFISTDDLYLLGVLNSSTLLDWVSKKFSPLQGGYFEFRGVSMEKLPIPNAPQSERKAVAKLAEQAQKLHTQRRKRVEKFLREIGVEPAESTSRNPLEQVWSLGEEEFLRRTQTLKVSETFRVYQQAREETMSTTEETLKVEREIDERVKSLYGL